MDSMSIKGPKNGQANQKIGYTRVEFRSIFQVYSENVYSGLFRDFSFSELSGRYFISFREEAGQTPLITVEKRRLGPDRVLFVATSPSLRGRVVEIARSEKLDSFVKQLRMKIENYRTTNEITGSNVKSMM